MPVFICEACNETLKQTKVATHNCSGCWYFSCIDCNKKFGWDEYKSHTKCVTEAERYQGHLYVAKENKGEKKQADWLGSVHAKMQAGGGDKRLSGYMERLLEFDNVPRKRAKFINFAKNSLNLKADREGIADKLWDLVAPDKLEEGSATPGAPSPAAATTPAATDANRRGSQLPSMPSATNIGSLMPGAGANGGKTESRVPESERGDDDANSETKSAKEDAKAAKRAAKESKRAAKTEKSAASNDQDEGSSAAGKKRTRDGEGEGVTAENEAKLGHGGKRVKGQPQPAIDTKTKPIKWKKIIAKELKTEGGSMSLKALKKACVAEARAHPSYKGRDKEKVKEEFDEVLPTFHKFKVHNNIISFAEGQKGDDD